MDLWTYLTALLRWWWLVVLVPAVAFGVAFFVLFPSAPWQASWNALITFEGNPAKSNSFNYVDFVVLDDMQHLLHSDVLGDQVYMQLPGDVTGKYSREQIGGMFSAYRNARFVEIRVTGDEPGVVEAVARTTEAILPEAVNDYLIPEDYPAIPGRVETMDAIGEPEHLTRDRWMKVGAVTAAGGIAALGLVWIAERLVTGYRAKYGAR